MDELLELLAQRRGIGQVYGYLGKTTQTSMENKQAILDAMGCATTEPEVLSEQISHEILHTGNSCWILYVY